MDRQIASPVREPLAADPYERILAVASIILLILATTAVAKGHDDWSTLPPLLWCHLFTIGLALALTPVMLLRRRGDRLHRLTGWVWSVAMFGTAVITLFVRVINPGHLSPIHLLSALTIVSVPLLVWRARSHRVAQHRRGVRTLVTAGLLLAGTLAFPFGRLLGRWLIG